MDEPRSLGGLGGPETWSIVNRLLEQALDLPEAERERWLATLAPEYQPHAATLRELLLHGERSPLDALPSLEPSDTATGTRVGAYRLVRKLGEGGMGTVWLAERTDVMTARPVALKLARSSWSGAAFVERLAHEREILAALDHPHIARLFDAGVTEDGQPFLALEYVDGQTIDVHLREQGLDLRARLALALQICDAVAHAHGRLIVHRDLKPSNVLVARGQNVRLLDFGIARLLEGDSAPETDLTREEGRVFTPNFASPEQLAGEPIGTSSDIYSLGVLLYGLIAEAPPYQLHRRDGSSYLAALDAIEVPRPSQAAPRPELARALRGDLDTILLKAMARVPADRYATANALADDLRRYLGGYPVLARPDGGAYRFRKLLRRHRAAALAIAAIVIAIVGGAAAALWQAGLAHAEARRAEAVKEFIADIFRAADPYRGATPKPPNAVELLVSAKQRLDRAAAAGPEMRLELLTLIGGSLADLQEYDKAMAVLEEAIAFARTHFRPDYRQALVARVERLDCFRVAGRSAEARSELDALYRILHAHPDENEDLLATLLGNEANLAVDEGRYAEAVSAAKQAIALATKLWGADDDRVITARTTLVVAYIHGKDTVNALPAAEAALKTNLARHPALHPAVIKARAAHASALALVDRPREAAAELGKAAEDAALVFGPTTTMAGFFLGQRAAAELAARDLPGALGNIERSLSIVAAEVKPESTSYASLLAIRGHTHLVARRPKQALPDLEAAAATLRKTVGPTHEKTWSAEVDVATVQALLGDIDADATLAELSQAAPADAAMNTALYARGIVKRVAGEPAEALALEQAALSSIAERPAARRLRMRVLAETALDLVDLGRFDDAGRALDEAMPMFAELETGLSPEAADATLAEARRRMQARRPAEALPLLVEVDRLWSELSPQSRWAGEAARWLGRCQADLGDLTDAEPTLARARRLLAGWPYRKDLVAPEIHLHSP